MKHIVEPLFVSHCILVQYCFLSFVSIILRHLCPVHQVRADCSYFGLRPRTSKFLALIMRSFNDAIVYGLQKSKFRDVREHERKVIESYCCGKDVFLSVLGIGTYMLVDLLTSRALRARSAIVQPCLEARSAIVGARASERVARASESSTCFPCWKSNQVTLFWRELFRVRSCLKRLKLSKLLFACLIMGSKPRLFCADQPRLFPSCFTNSRKYMYLLILNVMGL